MSLTPEKIFETNQMILEQSLDIRTTTLGINLKNCIHSDFEQFQANVYNKVFTNAQKLIKKAKELEVKYGIPIVNKRIAITPISLVMETHCEKSKFIAMAKTLDKAASDAGIDFIG